MWREEDLIADHRALDFINTVSDTDKHRHRNRLDSWDRALGWAVFAGILDPREADDLRGCRDRQKALEELLAFRECAYRILHARAAGQVPSGDDLGSLQAEIQRAQAAGELISCRDGFGWRHGLERSGREVLRHRLTNQLWGLMSGPEISRLRECGRCSWLFLNKGRGVGRRWCRMSTCGNRAKAAAYRANHE